MTRYECGLAAGQSAAPVYYVAPEDLEAELGERPAAPGHAALIIGDPYATAYAVEGTLEELRAFVARLSATLPAAPESGDLGDEYRECARCGDQVRTLSTSDLCDGCEAEGGAGAGLASAFTADEIEALIAAAADLWNSGVGDPYDVLSGRQKTMLDLASSLRCEEDPEPEGTTP